ncbi:MAG TPA: hypothetical protein VMA09_09965 [Candidatus Binataceae bacterium]|nr:hypothetical protein [Candidatus Binataceae bacterium]
MTRAQLVLQEEARLRLYGRTYWIFAFAIVGGAIAIPSLDGVSPTLASFTGNSWLVPLIVGYGLITILNQSKMMKCPRCRKALNGALAITTGRCSRCGEIALDDFKSN